MELIEIAVVVGEKPLLFAPDTDPRVPERGKGEGREKRDGEADFGG